MTALRKTISRFFEKIRAASLEKRYLDSVMMFDELRSEFQANPPPESEVIEFLEGVYKSNSLSDANLGLPLISRVCPTRSTC
ncbi:hypothetical protein Plim_0996 [Planctopirus limnophila DSM 3776]|uniref:Uncharacterized protein n=1 Tax=Planctopirus limnophila (strain ATCC 43296 / DSM 3776 / IFAM 1008 / Mu 290) TaxID=521674 RepID=D5ST71_PLAL2|nr:hypothetical protein [Planctopirus limnophila]ADG66839.1 hypothetical protein Plim_0996 [Planctopirus limnophila DSM 3776]